MNNGAKPTREIALEWFRFAMGDLAVAEREMQGELPVFHTICFLCQSAAEKFLKGYLIAQGWSLEKTHDLVSLVELCADFDMVLGNMLAEAATLNEFSIAGRYPGDLVSDSISRVDADDALAAAQQFRSRVMTLIGI